MDAYHKQSNGKDKNVTAFKHKTIFCFSSKYTIYPCRNMCGTFQLYTISIFLSSHQDLPKTVPFQTFFVSFFVTLFIVSFFFFFWQTKRKLFSYQKKPLYLSILKQYFHMITFKCFYRPKYVMEYVVSYRNEIKVVLKCVRLACKQKCFYSGMGFIIG